MKRKLGAILAAFLATAAASIACGNSVSEQLERATAAGEVRVSELTDFEWEALLIFGAYTTLASAGAALGFPWPEFERFGLESSDAFWLLAFTNQGTVTHAEKHSRCKPDFSPDDLAQPFSPVARASAAD